MNKQITLSNPKLATAPAMPTVERYRLDLAGSYSIDDYGALIPLDDLREARRELTAAMAPASSSQVERCVALLVAGYPQRGPAVPDLYLAALAADLVDCHGHNLPADIVRDACIEARRTIKFLPASSELHEIAIGLVDVRHRMIRRVGEMEREHERRRRVAEERDRYERQRIERIEALEAKLDQLLGDEAPHSGDYQAAVEIVFDGSHNAFAFNQRRRWEKDLNAGQLWAVRLCRRLGIAGRAKAFASGPAATRRLDVDQVIEVIRLATDDEVAARKYLLDVEMGRIARGQHRSDPVANWTHVAEGIAGLVDAAWAEVVQLERDDHRCAIAELHTRRTPPRDIERFVSDVMFAAAGAAERQAELAAANRTREAPGDDAA